MSVQEIHEDFLHLLGNPKNQSCLTSCRSAIYIPEPGNPGQSCWPWVDYQHAKCRERTLCWKLWLMNLCCTVAMWLYNMPDSQGSIRYIFVHVWLPGTSHTWKIQCVLKTVVLCHRHRPAVMHVYRMSRAFRHHKLAARVTLYNHLSF